MIFRDEGIFFRFFQNIESKINLYYHFFSYLFKWKHFLILAFFGRRDFFSLFFKILHQNYNTIIIQTFTARTSSSGSCCSRWMQQRVLGCPTTTTGNSSSSRWLLVSAHYCLVWHLRHRLLLNFKRNCFMMEENVLYTFSLTCDEPPSAGVGRNTIDESSASAAELESSRFRRPIFI